MDSVLLGGAAAMVAALVPLLVGAFVISSDRLRSAATSDLALLDRVERGDAPMVANVVRASMLRNAVLSAARSTYPPILLSEALAIVASLTLVVLVPIASLRTPTIEDSLLAVCAVVASTMLHGIVTLGWLRRAVLRASMYHEIEETRDTDAREAVRQIRLLQVLQAGAFSLALCVPAALLPYTNVWRDWTLVPLVCAAFVLGFGTVFWPLKRDRIEPKSTNWKKQAQWKDRGDRGSLWQLIDTIEVAGKYPERPAVGQPSVRKRT